MANLFPFEPLDIKKHIFSNSAFGEMCKDAIRAFNATPVATLPPEKFWGAGVYAIYCTSTTGIYEKFGNQVNRLGYERPIYIGSAVPKGWRKSRTAGMKYSNGQGTLCDRLHDHAQSIAEAKNLSLEDFACRFMIF